MNIETCSKLLLLTLIIQIIALFIVLFNLKGVKCESKNVKGIILGCLLLSILLFFINLKCDSQRVNTRKDSAFYIGIGYNIIVMILLGIILNDKTMCKSAKQNTKDTILIVIMLCVFNIGILFLYQRGLKYGVEKCEQSFIDGIKDPVKREKSTQKIKDRIQKDIKERVKIANNLYSIASQENKDLIKREKLTKEYENYNAENLRLMDFLQSK